MPKIDVLIEFKQPRSDGFATFRAAAASESESYSQAELAVQDLAGYGLEISGDLPPVPMFAEKTVFAEEAGFREFAMAEENDDVAATTIVVAAEIDRSKLAKLESEANVTVWPNSPLTLFSQADEPHVFDLARTGTSRDDCRPFRPAVTIETLRELLGVQRIWKEGYRGQNIIVGIIDEGVNGEEYPVVGGFSRPNAQRPGTASIQSHGSMCAADVLVAAPMAKLYDYPFLGVPNSGGALTMFQAVLDQRRIDGTPHITNNSYGFVGRPPKAQFPHHEVWDRNHPVHRKVREVVASGSPTFFAAGNCGSPCPSGNCHTSGIGPGISIHASNSLAEVITVAAVNSRHERIGYSSQGPGGFESEKPDVSAYSHFFGNFGPGRPAGGTSFDNGTSAATPVAAGVGALLLSAFAQLTPDQLKQALIGSATNLGLPGWDADTGHGVINAAAAYNLIARGMDDGQQDVPAGRIDLKWLIDRLASLQRQLQEKI